MMAPEPNVQTTQKSNTSHSVGVSVTTKTEATPVGEGLDINPHYFRTIPGMLKIIQLLIAIICMGCASPVVTHYTHFFMFVVATCFIFTVLFCTAYLFSLKELFKNVPWLMIELGFTALAVIFYFLAVVVQLSMTSRNDYYIVLNYYGYYKPYIAAGSFAVFNTVAYLIGAYFLYKDWNNSRGATSTPATNGNAS